MQSNFNVAIGKRLKQLRESANMTSKELADSLYLSEAMVGLIERGQRGLRTSHLPTLNKLFGVSADFLIFGKDDNKQDVWYTPEEKALAFRFIMTYRNRLNKSEKALVCKLVNEYISFYLNKNRASINGAS